MEGLEIRDGVGPPKPDDERLARVWDQFYAYCFTIINQCPGVRRLSETDREDCVQDVMVEIVRRFGVQRPDEMPDQITGWIRVLSRNKAADIARRRIRKPEVAFDDGAGEAVAASKPASAAGKEGDGDESSAYVSLVWEALVNLDQQVPVTSYLVFYLKSIENWTYEEIADLFQMTSDQARARCHRVRQKFGAIVKSTERRRSG